MIEANTKNVSKSKKKIAKGNKISYLKHLAFILVLFFQKNQKSIYRILMLIIGVFLALGIGEITLRILEKPKYDLAFCTSLDKNFHHVMIPNKSCRYKTDEWDVIYKINNMGLRAEEIPQYKEINEFRILILGDSFAQGHGVESDKTFTKILEKKLNENSTGKFRVINSGVFGYSPLIEYLYLRKGGLNFKPDLVILTFGTTEFWEDIQRFTELQISYPQLSNNELKEKIAHGDVEFDFAKINSQGASPETKEALPIVSGKIKLWFRKNFKVYAKFADFVKKKNLKIQQDVINQGNIDKDIVAIMRGDKTSNEDYEELWQLPIENIKLMDDLLKKEGINLIIVGIPDAVQVSDQEWPGRTGLSLPQHFTDPRGDFQDKLSKELTSLDIPFINLLVNFRKSKIFPLYFANDGHWRASGHELAAGIIYNTLNTPNFYYLLNR